jgi:uncharacterized protein YndB with AHSA1/START domain
MGTSWLWTRPICISDLLSVYHATQWLRIRIATDRLHNSEGEMEELVERELTVPDGIDEVWDSLAEPEWLGDDAKIDLREAGEVNAGERTGFVEEVEAPHRLAFWWSAPGEESTRVELELDETEAGTLIRVTESRPLAILDGRDLAIEFGGMSGGTGPMASSGAMLAGAPA